MYLPAHNSMAAWCCIPMVRTNRSRSVRTRTCDYIAVSPDGRWVATGSHSGTKVKVWHAQSGKLEKELPIETGSRVSFSPNGKWLATTGDGCRLWAVESWQGGPAHWRRGTGGGPRLRLDGKLLAVETGDGVVRLVDPDSGREYARLEDPNQDQAAR